MHIAVLDDHKMITDMVRGILQDAFDVANIVTFTSSIEFKEHVKNEDVDIVVVDIFMPDINGLEVIKMLRKAYDDNQLKIIVLSSFISIKIMKDVIKLGANAYVTKQDAVSDLISAIEHMEEGDTKPFFSKNATLAMVESIDREEVVLSPREKQLLECMCDGLTAKEIAHNLNLSVNTIHFYTKRLMSKMNVNRTIELVLKAFEEGYVLPK